MATATYTDTLIESETALVEPRSAEWQVLVAAGLQQAQQLEAWARQQIWEPAAKVGIALANKLRALLEPHIEALMAAAQPHLLAIREKAAPYLAKAKSLHETTMESVGPRLVELQASLKPRLESFVVAVGAKLTSCATATTEHTKTQSRRLSTFAADKSQAWLQRAQRAIQERTDFATKDVQRHVKLTQSVWGGAVAGAAHVHKDAQQLHEVRSTIALATAAKASALRDEDFDRAKAAKFLEGRLSDLAVRAEQLVLAKADALFAEDYEAAAKHKSELDSIVVRVEEMATGMRGVDPAAASLIAPPPVDEHPEAEPGAEPAEAPPAQIAE